MKKLITYHIQMLIDALAYTDPAKWEDHYKEFYKITAMNLRTYLKASGEWIDVEHFPPKEKETND